MIQVQKLFETILVRPSLWSIGCQFYKLPCVRTGKVLLFPSSLDEFTYLPTLSVSLSATLWLLSSAYKHKFDDKIWQRNGWSSHVIGYEQQRRIRIENKLFFFSFHIQMIILLFAPFSVRSYVHFVHYLCLCLCLLLSAPNIALPSNLHHFCPCRLCSLSLQVPSIVVYLLASLCFCLSHHDIPT